MKEPTTRAHHPITFDQCNFPQHALAHSLLAQPVTAAVIDKVDLDHASIQIVVDKRDLATLLATVVHHFLERDLHCVPADDSVFDVVNEDAETLHSIRRRRWDTSNVLAIFVHCVIRNFDDQSGEVLDPPAEPA